MGGATSPVAISVATLHRRLWRYGRITRIALGLAIGIGLLAAALIVAQATLLAAIVARVFLHGASLSGVFPSLWVLGGVIAMRALVAWAADAMAHLCSAPVKSRLRVELIERVLALGPAYLNGERTGELTNTATRGVDALDSYYARYLPQLALGVLVPVVMIGWILRFDLLSALILAVTVPLVPVFMWLVGIAANRKASGQWQALSLLSAHFLDVIEGLPTLKLFGRSLIQRETIRRVSDQYRVATMGSLRVAFLSSMILELATTISTALVAVGVGLRLVGGSIDLQSGLTVLLLVPEVYLPLRLVGAQFHTSAESVAAAGRIFQVIDLPNPGIVPSASLSVPELDRGVRFEAVSFSYPNRPEFMLKEVSFALCPGETVALVGASGSGKSTVLALLLGFVRPTSGRITSGGVDIADIGLEAWRRQLSWLPQRPHLFRGSVADNVRVGSLDADDAAVHQALARAGLGSWVDLLPAGPNTQIGEKGDSLSGGERQRIALARALIRHAPVLLLDEPTANLDADTAQHVQRMLENLPRWQAALYVVHDPVIARRADRVIELESGCVVGRAASQAYEAVR